MNSHSTPSTILLLAVAVFVAVSYASTQQYVLRSKASYDEVWKACVDSLIDVRFSASSADPKTGLVVAEQAVVGGRGTVSRLNITLTRVGDSTKVGVNFVPPPGTIGGYNITDNYVKAVKKRVPNIELVGIGTTKDNRILAGGAQTAAAREAERKAREREAGSGPTFQEEHALRNELWSPRPGRH